MRRWAVLLAGLAALGISVAVASFVSATRDETRSVLAQVSTLVWRLAVAAFVFTLALTPAGFLVESNGEHERSGPSLPSYSPDGAWLAFTSDRSGKDEIYVARAGNAASKTTDSEHGVGALAWSPDGSRIVFSRLTGDDWPDPESSGLFVVNRDGTGLRQVTRGEDYSPCWAADGRTIVFGRGENVYAVRSDGTQRRLLLRNASAPACSPTRPAVAVTDGASIRIIDLEGGRTRSVVPRDAGEMSSPTWSLDGRRIAFDAWRDRVPSDPVIEEGPWAVPWYFSELFVVDADGGGLRRLTENSVGDRWPQWTPDGRILFVSNRAGPDDLTNGDESDFYVMNADGSGVEVFAWDPSYS